MAKLLQFNMRQETLARREKPCNLILDSLMRISYFPNVTAQSGIEQSITHLVLWEDSEHEVEEAVEHQIYTIGRARNVG